MENVLCTIRAMHMHKQRIELTDTVQSTLIKMSEGNPGAISVLLQLYQKGGAIDPDNAFKGLGPLLSLDTVGIYGSDIWILYKDICRENIEATIGLLRAAQLGLLSESTLLGAISSSRDGTSRDGTEVAIDVEKVMAEVKVELPNFGKQAA